MLGWFYEIGLTRREQGGFFGFARVLGSVHPLTVLTVVSDATYSLRSWRWLGVTARAR